MSPELKLDEHGQVEPGSTWDQIKPVVFTVAVLAAIAAIASPFIEANQAVQAAQAEATQIAHLLGLQDMLQAGGADCHFTVGGTLHHVGQLLRDGTSNVFHLVGPHLTGPADALQLVTDSAEAVSHVTVSPDELPSVINAIASQPACLVP